MLEGDLCDDAVGGAAHAQTTTTALKEDPGRFNVTRRQIDRGQELLAREIGGESGPFLFITCALQDFLDDDGRQANFVSMGREHTLEITDGNRVPSGEKVDENRGIDQNHVPLRDAL